MFLVFINDLSTGLSPNPRFFVDDISPFLVAYDRNTLANESNNDLFQIRKPAYQKKKTKKKIFNNDLSKQAQKVIFCRKIKNLNDLVLDFNNIHVNQAL